VVRGNGVFTTQSDETAELPTDPVERDFTARAPSRLLVADLTYAPAWAGFVDVPLGLDVYSRFIVGFGNSRGVSVISADGPHPVAKEPRQLLAHTAGAELNHEVDARTAQHHGQEAPNEPWKTASGNHHVEVRHRPCEAIDDDALDDHTPLPSRPLLHSPIRPPGYVEQAPPIRRNRRDEEEESTRCRRR